MLLSQHKNLRMKDIKMVGKKEHIYFVDTKLLCYYLFQRGSSLTGLYDKIAQLLFSMPKGKIYLGWDIGKSSYRLKVSPTYKGHREADKAKLSEDDQEAHKQFNSDYLKLAGISDLLPVFNLKVQGVECDDMCSILAKRYENNEMYQVYLLTADMDWIHSVVGTNNVSIIDVYNGGTIIDHDYVVQTYNLDTRKKFTVLKSILGDKSDNIKFCNNIGPVKAKEIFNLIYTKYNDPSNDEMLEVINEYLAKKEQDRVSKNRTMTISIHNDHVSAGRLNANDAFLANMSIADPFQDTSYLTDAQLKTFNKCLSRVLPESVQYADIMNRSIVELGFAIPFGYKASKVFKVL